jgi:hypothetical protein
VIEAIVEIGAENEPADVLGSIERTLSAYPTTYGWQHPDRGGLEPPQWVAGGEARGQFVLWWRSPSPHIEAVRGYVDMVAPEYRFDGERWLWPSTTGDGINAPVLLSPLMTWWALLLGLSIIARYEPANWGRLLEVGSCGWAVAIEHTLGRAINVIPHLVRDALLGEQSLLVR